MKKHNFKQKLLVLLSCITVISNMTFTTFAEEDEDATTSNSSQERVIQIAIPDEKGILQFYTGEEAQAIYNQIEKEAEQVIPIEEIESSAISSIESDEEIKPKGMFTYKYRFVTRSEGKKWGNNSRISAYACNGTSLQQSKTVSASASVSWGINVYLSGKFKEAFTAKVGYSWSQTSSFSDSLTVNVAPKKRVWLEFKPRLNYINGEAQKYYVSRGPRPTIVIAERKQVSSESPTTVKMNLGDNQIVSCPDGAYIWKEDGNYKFN